jgi:hypothetical protein
VKIRAGCLRSFTASSSEAFAACKRKRASSDDSEAPQLPGEAIMIGRSRENRRAF